MTVLLTEKQLTRDRMERQASQRGKSLVAIRNPHAGLTREIDGKLAADIHAIELARNVAASPGTQDDERGAIDRELEGPRHAGGHNLHPGGRGRPFGRHRTEDEQRTDEGHHETKSH